jgi:hypothetical protein
MRQFVTALLVLVTLAIGAPLVGADQSAAALTGQLVDAGGRGVVGQPVDLVRDGAVVTSTVTTVNGEFMFTGVAPGSYVVRTMVNNHSAGTRIAVKAGESIPVTVVLPSLATASPVVGPLASFITSVTLSSGVALTNSVWIAAQKINDGAFIQNINLTQIQNFLNNSGLIGAIDGIKIGPYGTF